MKATAELARGMRMGIADKLKSLTKKAEDAAVEHQDQLLDAVQKAEVAADKQTGGKYHDQISKAGAKAEGYVEGLKPEDASSARGPAHPTE
jgi:DNA-binding protein H-NS